MSDPTVGKLVWPPTKEDLKKLYLLDRLSAAKIAKVYDLNYKNAKVAESTVLYQLKRNGIKRRDRAEHTRKVCEVMVDEWVGRYQAGESLKQIAAANVDPVTVWNHLKARGLVLRDKIEAQIQAVSKYERKPFQGDDVERAYLMGLRYGDLHVVRHGRAIRVRVSTTHPAMAELFEELFSSYGHVSSYPRRERLVGFEWTLECDLDGSFEFLLQKPSISELESWTTRMFLAFLAGLFDAEGSILMHNKMGRRNPEIAISNSDRNLIDYLFGRLKRMGFSVHAIWARQRNDRHGISGESIIGRVVIWRFAEVQEFLRRLPLRHREKTAKAEVVRALVFASSDSRQVEVFERWEKVRASIREDRNRYLQEAASAVSEREKRHPSPESLKRPESSRSSLNEPKMG